MTEKDYTLYGAKIYNNKTKEIGLLICTWKNKFADKDIDFATWRHFVITADIDCVKIICHVP